VDLHFGQMRSEGGVVEKSKSIYTSGKVIKRFVREARQSQPSKSLLEKKEKEKGGRRVIADHVIKKKGQQN